MKVWIQNVGDEGEAPIEIWAAVGEGEAEARELVTSLSVGLMHEAHVADGERLEIVKGSRETQTIDSTEVGDLRTLITPLGEGATEESL
jgi:hypothetical protein